MFEYLPEKYARGWLIEDWEADFDKAVLHVRPGVMWQGLNQGRRVMEDRELIAADVVADLKYLAKGPARKAWFEQTFGDIYATDRYTVVMEFTNFDFSWWFLLGYEDRAVISPPETEGSDNWADQVGTGPFMLKEYSVGSYMKYERNPNYWRTTTIDGVEYQIPFVDEMIWPIVLDESTRVAALRTGAVDWYEQLPASYWPSLDACPGIVKVLSPAAGGQLIGLKCSEPPFDNVNVRRAMMVGTNMKAFSDVRGVGPLPIDWFPCDINNPELYTPLEELPADIQLLYDYNPELAKQMLADADYPNGLEIDLYCDTNTLRMDYAAMFVDQWAKIGVTVTPRVFEQIAWNKYLREGTYTGAILYGGGSSNPFNGLSVLGRTGDYFNFAYFSNERYDELYSLAAHELDSAKQVPLLKEQAEILRSQVPYIPLSTEVIGSYYWPWIKNYYGEINVGDWEVVPFFADAWLDQDLKAEMGY